MIIINELCVVIHRRGCIARWQKPTGFRDKIVFSSLRCKGMTPTENTFPWSLAFANPAKKRNQNSTTGTVENERHLAITLPGCATYPQDRYLT